MIEDFEREGKAPSCHLWASRIRSNLQNNCVSLRRLAPYNSITSIWSTLSFQPLKMAANILYVHNFIDGEFRPTSNYLDSFNPATSLIWAKVPDSGEKEVNDAVLAAKEAFPKWSGLSPKQRSAMMMRVADIVESKCHEFALAESQDQGKTLIQAESIEIPRAVFNMRHFASSCLHSVNKAKTQDEFGVVNYTLRQPIGVAGLISPWNLPLYLLTFKIAPAISVGNTVVCKPSEMTSVTAFMFCSALKEAGIPPGVVNMVFGTGPKVGEPLVVHPDVKMISFTGSTPVGRRIYSLASERFKKISLEMGGKNAGIIFDDADLSICLQETIRSSFSNQGEICLCTSRLFVQAGVYQEFVKRFVEETRKIQVGSPLNPAVSMGALISADHLNKVRKFITLAEAEGATILTGDKTKTLDLPKECRKGYFLQPTVITDIKDTSECMTDEIFGPVVCITPFSTESEVIERVNSVKYGLCAAVWSRDVGKVHRVAEKLQVGTVWLNCWLIRCLDMPFGGCKDSGIGREGTEESLELFTETKTVCLKYK